MAYAMSDAEFNRRMGLVKASLARLARVPSRAARKVAPRIRRLVTEQFSYGKDPYDRGWAKLAPSTVRERIRKGHLGPPLTDYGKMRRGVRVEPAQSAGVRIRMTQRGKVATFHQFGTVRMPARPILPTGNIPKRWHAVIVRAVQEELREATR